MHASRENQASSCHSKSDINRSPGWPRNPSNTIDGAPYPEHFCSWRGVRSELSLSNLAPSIDQMFLKEAACETSTHLAACPRLMVISIATTTTSFKPSTPSLSQKPDWQSGIVSQPAKEPHLRATSPCMSPDPMSQQEQCQRLNQRRLSELVNLWLTTSFKSR